VKVLGENSHPVPVEALPFAASLVKRRIEELGGKPVLREGKGKVGPVITDNGNLIIDTYFGLVHKPDSLEHQIKSIPGIVETGLFVKMASTAYIGKRFNDVQKLTGKQTKISRE
jgi:ribose 5-phosphate isomerase A